MDKIILKDKTTYELLDGSSIGNIQIITDNVSTVNEIYEKFTKDNVSKVTITTNDIVSGKYDNLVVDHFSHIKNEDETGYVVTVSLRTKTEIEKRLDALEQGHIDNATAIDSIITDIIPVIDESDE